MKASDAPKFADIRYVGSFQNGRLIRSGEPLSAVWKQIARTGTVESIQRISSYKGVPTNEAKTASLRIRQAIELRKASKETSALTRPLMLYYSALNLVRGVAIALTGSKGTPGHGLRFQGNSSLLDCGASLSKSGTFCELLKVFGQKEDPFASGSITLRDALSLVPEIAGDFSLLNRGPPTIVAVEVQAYMSGKVSLRYALPASELDDFNENWQTMLPWWKDVCTLSQSSMFTLEVSAQKKDFDEISSLCEGKLSPDLHWREDPIWYDHILRPGIEPIFPIGAYLLALFILSNISRYEPELLDTTMREPNDESYVINTFLDCAERYLPQLALNSLYRPKVWFV